jgi:hypothetical protein
MKFIAFTLFISVLVFSGFAKADYIIASRDMLLKEAPDRNANTISSIKKQNKLLVVEGRSQQNGYYTVELLDGTIGYMYKTVGRLERRRRCGGC